MRSKSAVLAPRTLARRENGHAAFSAPLAAFAVGLHRPLHVNIHHEFRPNTPTSTTTSQPSEPSRLSSSTSSIADTMANSLEGCVSSLRSSMQLLDSSISILDTGINDFPRMSKVLQTTRVSSLTK